MFWIIAGLVFVAFFFATCVCCGCIYYSYHSQTSTTDLSDGWTEVSGSWATDGLYITTTDTNAILIHNEETPSEGGYMIVGFIAPSSYVSSGNRSGSDKLRIFFNYVDTNNWHCLEFGDVTKLIKKTSGTEVTVAQLDSEATVTPARICIRDSGLVTWSDTTHIHHAFASYTTFHSGGKKWGFGSGDTNAGGVFVNMPAVSRYNGGLVTPDDTQDGTCQGCGVCVGCQYYGSPLDDDPPEQVQIEITAFPNGTTGTTCPNLEGTWIADYRGSWQSTPGYSRWVADISSAGAQDLKQMTIRTNGNRDGSGVVQLVFYNTTDQNAGTASGGSCGHRLEWTIPSAAAICTQDTARTFTIAPDATRDACCDYGNASATVTWLS